VLTANIDNIELKKGVLESLNVTYHNLLQHVVIGLVLVVLERLE
jgi:hypothetical protein